MPGPSAARRSDGREPAVDERGHRGAAPPRPRCLASRRGRRPRAGRSGSTSSTGRQSAVSMPRRRPGAVGDRGVGLGTSLPRAPRRPWRRGPASAGEGGPAAGGPPHTRARVASRGSPGRRQPLLEAVDEAGHGVEGGDACGLERGSGVGAITRQDRNPRTSYAAIVGHCPIEDERRGGRKRCRGRGDRRGRSGSSRGPPAAGDLPSRPAERAYARSKTDPERRLAARLAAKRAAVRAPGRRRRAGGRRGCRGALRAARLRLSPRAGARARGAGRGRALVSLTHERATPRRPCCCCARSR